jgi:ABC-type hemin transport system substrate-binding protein
MARMILQSAADVIARLGGTRAVADRCAIAQATVNCWIQREGIPPAYFLMMEKALNRRGYKSDPTKVYGMKAAKANRKAVGCTQPHSG